MGDSSKDDTDNKNNTQVVQVLEALKQASHDIQQDHHSSDSPAINALLELHTILSTDPNLSTLSHHLNRLKSLVDSLHNSKGLRSFLTRPLSTHSIARVAASIESELQAWIDRETTETLSRLLKDPLPNDNELVPPDSHAGLAVAALIRFNKDVFVGEVLMGPTVRALVSMASVNSIDVLCSLIRSIRSPIVDEIESNGEIPKIIELLNSQGGFGGDSRGVAEIGGWWRLIELDRKREKEEIRVGGKRFLEGHPFASCVARFAVQLEVGEGLRQRERRAFKPEILDRVKKASF
ncbi:hypothetical protein SESBI_47324 [Sesbania bispinosa]|nr:hypothetical protein SESBI_47324 [Sesbania bispinosa]